MGVYYIDMNTNNIMSQVELNKTLINRYFEAYNNKNESIFDKINHSRLHRPWSNCLYGIPWNRSQLEQRMTLRIYWIN